MRGESRSGQSPTLSKHAGAVLIPWLAGLAIPAAAGLRASRSSPSSFRNRVVVISGASRAHAVTRGGSASHADTLRPSVLLDLGWLEAVLPRGAATDLNQPTPMPTGT
jgi:hypothetical protein